MPPHRKTRIRAGTIGAESKPPGADVVSALLLTTASTMTSIAAPPPCPRLLQAATCIQDETMFLSTYPGANTPCPAHRFCAMGATSSGGTSLRANARALTIPSAQLGRIFPVASAGANVGSLPHVGQLLTALGRAKASSAQGTKPQHPDGHIGITRVDNY